MAASHLTSQIIVQVHFLYVTVLSRPTTNLIKERFNKINQRWFLNLSTLSHGQQVLKIEDPSEILNTVHLYAKMCMLYESDKTYTLHYLLKNCIFE